MECCTDTGVNRDNGECKVTVIVFIHVEDTALNVHGHVLSHFINLGYTVCITLGWGDQDMNRHFLHKHLGNKVYISGD